MTDSSTPVDPAALDAPANGRVASTKKSKPRSQAPASRKASSGEAPAGEPISAAKPVKSKKATKSTGTVSALGPETELPAELSIAEPQAVASRIVEPPATEPPATEPQATEPPATEPQATEPPATEPEVAAPLIAALQAVEAQVAEVQALSPPDEPTAEPIGEDAEEADDSERLIQEPRFWQDDGWTAKVIKNEDDEGWAVAMTLDGEPEPALVGPWTMGRDKKNPKPLDANAFSVLVKTAYEVRRRHEQALHAMLHKTVTVEYQGDRCKVSLQIIPDEYEPHAFLRAFDPLDDLLAEVRVEANFKLTNQSAERWIANDFRRPGGN